MDVPDWSSCMRRVIQNIFNSELDTYWIQHGGGDPAAWIRKLKGRADIIHLKDMAMDGRTQLFAEVGEGNLNWARDSRCL